MVDWDNHNEIMGYLLKEKSAAFDERIQELVHYAREHNGEDRSALFRNLVDIFMTEKAPQRLSAREQLLDILEALIPHVDPEVRRTTSELLSRMPERPMDLVIRLVRDRASIVASLLRKAPFGEEDYINLIRNTGREHHQELASRHDLPANVWIELARAAPTAPIGDTPSTLALWRDELGNVTGDPTGKQASSFEENDSNVAVFKRNIEDENIIPASWASLAELDAGAQMVESEESDLNPVSSGMPPSRDAGLSRQTAAAKKAIPPDVKPSRMEKQLKDPCPGGWSWRSDPLGKVVELSDAAHSLFGDFTLRLLGGELADLLGLGDRPSHPILRAVDRRGPIHDAPILLREMQSGKRNWTLEARPQFAIPSGRFEGYKGELVPVLVSEEQKFHAESPHWDALLQHDIEPDGPVKSSEFYMSDGDSFDSIIDPSPAVKVTKVVHKEKGTDDKQNADQKRAQYAAKKQSAKIGATEEKIIPKPVFPSAGEMRSKARAARGMADDARMDAYPKSNEKSAKKAFKATPVQAKVKAPKAVKPAPKPEVTSAQQKAVPDRAFSRPKGTFERQTRRRNNMFATLELMHEAAGRLKSTNRSTDPRAVHLDANIVSSCTKAILELLEEDALEQDLIEDLKSE